MITRPYLHRGEARYGDGWEEDGAISLSSDNNMTLSSLSLLLLSSSPPPPLVSKEDNKQRYFCRVVKRGHPMRARKSTGMVPLPSLTMSDDDISTHQACCERYPSIRIVCPAWWRDVGSMHKCNHFWRRQGTPPLWSLSLIAAAAQAYPTPAQEQQVRIHAHCPVEHIPVAIVIVANVAIINPPCLPPPPVQRRGDCCSSPAIRTPEKIDCRPESAIHEPPPPQHPWCVLIDICTIADPSCLGNAPVK
jgi:hypothetical protein